MVPHNMTHAIQNRFAERDVALHVLARSILKLWSRNDYAFQNLPNELISKLI